tara:strand:- start:90 stop:293 length:204 start_codon:yes stop_codon:yes gene_type:complete
MSWKEQLHPKESNVPLEGSDCEIRKCDAIKCEHNSNYKCTLPEVDIGSEGRCRMYQGKGIKRHLRGD